MRQPQVGEIDFKLQVGDIVESTDWRDAGKRRMVTEVPEKGDYNYGYVYLKSKGSTFSTRVLMRKSGEPQKYRFYRRPESEQDAELSW